MTVSKTVKTPTISTPETSLPSSEGGEEKKNKGGLIGGIYYTDYKIRKGLMSSIEGFTDFTIGGVAKLFGFDKFAERQFANSWHDKALYNPIEKGVGKLFFGDSFGNSDEWFNPGKGWSFAGDVAGGIGTSIPSLAVAAATAGQSLWVTAPAMFASAALPAAGNATTEAYQDTGKLTGKEFGYGALTGATEGGLEVVTNIIGMGTSAVVKSFGKYAAKESAEAVLREGLGYTLAKAFAGEAFEEGMAEILNAPIKRATYDPNAEGATAGQVLYASFVGGMSGVVMGGAGSVYTTAQNISRGNKLVEAGETEQVLTAAKYLAEKNAKGGADVGALKQVEVTYNKLAKSLAKTNGEVKTVAQKRMLGELKLDNIAAVVQPKVYRTATDIVSDPDAMVDRINTIGYTDSNGNKVTVTREMLLEGVDMNNLKGTLPTALQNNEILRDIAFMSLAGEMMLNVSQFQEAVLRGEKFVGEADLEHLLKTASPEEKQAVERLTNIDDLSTVDAATFNERVAALSASGVLDEVYARYQAKNTNSKGAITPENSANIAENGVEITEKTETITDKGEIATDNSNNAVKNEADTSRKALPDAEAKSTTASDKGEQMTVADSIRYANENIPEMKDLNAEEKSRVRRLIRQMKSKGFTDKQIRAYARVSARSGIDIVVDKEALRYENKKGETRYADGMYSPSRNKIFVNPEGSRSPARVLIHELTHAIYKTSKGKVLLEEGARNLSEEEKNRIVAKYFADDIVIDEQAINKYADELNAHYIEALLDDERLLEKLVESNPTLPEKILSFFKKAITGYSNEPTLSKEAKELYERYKQLFEMFSERSKYGAVKGKGEERHAFVGRTDDGRGIYRSNYPKNTPKAAKQKDIINLVQNVWSKKPIKLNLVVDGEVVPIEAKFNPELTERSDLSKIAFGNRKGTNSEKRITLDLSSDLFQIAEESQHVGSKIETGKDNPAHIGVSEWHYFVTNLVFEEADGTKVDCYMNIDVKQNEGGNWFYSFAIEKGTAPRTLLAGVTEKSATVPNKSISQNPEKSTVSAKKSSTDRKALSDEDFNLDDYTIEELLKFTPEQFEQAYDALGVDDILDDFSDLSWSDIDVSIDDISDKLGEDSKKVEILIHRQGLGDDYVDEKHMAVMKQSRLDEAIEDSGAKFNPDYSRKYITRISPKDFIDLTVSKNHLDRKVFDSNVRGDHGSTMSDYDYEKALQENKTPYLHIDRTTGRIIGHNGRHRMRALELAGIKSVELEVEFYDDEGYLIKYNANTIPDMAISSQFDTAIETHLSNIIPLNEAHRAEIERNYGEKANADAGVRYAISDEDIDIVGEEGYNYTKEQYERFGWARELDAITFNELSDLESKIKLKKSLNDFTHRSSKGETIIEVNDNPSTILGVDNVFAFVKGEKDNYYITRVIRFDAQTETEMEIYKERLYEEKSFSDTHLAFLERKGFATQYTRESAKSFAEYKESRKSRKTSRGANQDNRRSEEYRSRHTEDTRNNVNVVHTFNDISGKKKYVVKIGSDYYIKDNHRARPAKSIEQAVENENKRVILRYAKKHNTSAGHIMQLLENDSSFLVKARRNGDRFALSDEDVNPLDMSASVAKKRKAYDESLKEKVITIKDSIYIDTVDELYGLQKFLSIFGSEEKDAASMVQAARASMSAAQTMLGDIQKDIFSEDGKKLGDGLSRIIKPLYSRGEKVQIAFNEYILHWLNVDRMSLNEKSRARLDDESRATLEALEAQLADDEANLNKVNAKIAELKKSKKDSSDAEVKKQFEAKLEELDVKAKALKENIRELKSQINGFELMENKPVFGENETREKALTADDSRKRIAEIEKVHPDFKETAEKVWAYTKNLNHMRVEAGLISAESEAYMNELYPHYVPAYRDTEGGGIAAIRGKRNLAISSTVKTAKGSGLDVLDVVDSIASQTQEMIRAGRINQLFREVYDAAIQGKGTDYAEIVTREKVSGEQVAADSTSEELTSTIEVRPKGNQITGFVDGMKVTIKVSDELFIAFDSMGKSTIDPTSKLGQGAKKLNDIYKKLITSWSPAFLLRNPTRDVQDAGLNSKHARLFWKNLPKVYKMMYDNAELWQEYRAYGGFSASIFGEDGFSADVDKRGFEAMAKLFDTDAPTLKDMWEAAKRGGKNIFVGINNLNAFVEQATRFAEYVASREAGDSISVAIYNAAEVTTNFGRRGRLTKKLNATVMPFLNPAIQGFDKIFRNIGDAAKAGSPKDIAKAYASLISRAAIIGLAPMIVNMLMYGDDDDYEKLREADKENNFLIKVGDTFIKIPRGRLASVIGGAANRGYKVAKGEDADLQGYFENAMEQVTPVGNMTRTIISPFFDVRNNRTWYGSEIESRQWDNTSPKDRYDESTSSIAKAISDALHAVGIGKAMEISPKKVHYLLDQYSGVIGDFLLPATSKKAHKGFFSGNFTIDPTTSNKLSTKFYDLYDKAQYAKTAGDDTAIYQVKYLNSVKSAISEMHNEKQSIQKDSSLSNAEKLQKSRVVQALINQVYETAITDLERYTQAFEATKGIEDTEVFKNAFGDNASEATIQKMRYTEATRYMYGAKKALEEYDESVYSKCELLNLAGIDYDNLYYYYFATKGITSDTDKAGNVISGSKRKKVVAEVNKLSISTEQKLLLIAAKGYSVSDSDKKRLLKYILGLKTSKENREELAKMCGFKVKNGKIVVK